MTSLEMPRSFRSKLDRAVVGDTSDYEPAGFASALRALRTAAGNPFTLLPNLIAAVVALAWDPWFMMVWPAALGGGFLWTLGRTGLRRRRKELSESLVILPEAERFDVPEAREAIRRVSEARKKLEQALGDRPPGPAFDPPSVIRKVGGVERRILTLAARSEYLGRFLTCTSAVEETLERERLAGRRKGATGRRAKQLYTDAEACCASHMDSLEDLERQRHELSGELDYLLVALESLPVRLTQLQFLRLTAVDRLSETGDSGAGEMIDDLRSSVLWLEYEGASRR